MIFQWIGFPGPTLGVAVFNSEKRIINISLPRIGRLWKATKVLGKSIEDLTLEILIHEQHRIFTAYVNANDPSIYPREYRDYVEILDKEWKDDNIGRK